jgi:hypothetical protein
MIPFVVFLFLGHSNLTHNEDCHIPENPHVWCYGEQGIRHFNEVAPVMYFLNEMSLRYPGVDFVGVNFAYSSAMISEMVPGFYKYDKMMKVIDTLKTIACFGGAIFEYGIVEGGDSVKSNNFDIEFMRVVNAIRNRTGETALPCFLQRYETNSKESPEWNYFKYRDIVKCKIRSLEHNSKITLFPICELPTEYYIDGGHHFSCYGHRLAMSDAAALYQFNGYHWKEIK